MPIYYNSTEIAGGITYNGQAVQKVTYNGVEVWSATSSPLHFLYV